MRRKEHAVEGMIKNERGDKEGNRKWVRYGRIHIESIWWNYDEKGEWLVKLR